MSVSLPPIVRLAERLLVDIEQAVTKFARRHKYVIGSDLRTAAMKVARLALRAWRDREHQVALVDQLVWAIDDLKLTMQLGSRIKAFHSFAQFEAIARVASDLGRQAGGWRRQHQQHPKGQSSPAGTSPAKRAQILSTRAASSHEANP